MSYKIFFLPDCKVCNELKKTLNKIPEIEFCDLRDYEEQAKKTVAVPVLFCKNRFFYGDTAILNFLKHEKVIDDGF